MKAENNYDKLRQIEAETSPLPKEPVDVPTRATDPDLYDETKDKAQVEAEIEIEKHGVPIIDVERPPVPDVHTDTTKYKNVGVKRKAKKSDTKKPKEATEKLSLKEDREMKAFAEKLGIPVKQSIWTKLRKKLYDLYCKINRFALNRTRKKYCKVALSYDEMPQPLKKVELTNVNMEELKKLGYDRKFQREGDRSPQTVNMVRNKRTGVVVATPSAMVYKGELEDAGQDAGDYEVVESQIKG